MEELKPIFCFYCGKKTELKYKEIRKSFNNKIITIRKVPLFYCKDCREIFYPDKVIKVFNKLIKIELDSNHYDFETILDKIQILERLNELKES